MISRVLLFVPSFTKKKAFKNLQNFFKECASISPFVFNTLYCKFRLARLCQVIVDLGTYCYNKIVICTYLKNKTHKLRLFFSHKLLGSTAAISWFLLVNEKSFSFSVRMKPLRKIVVKQCF